MFGIKTTLDWFQEYIIEPIQDWSSSRSDSCSSSPSSSPPSSPRPGKDYTPELDPAPSPPHKYAILIGITYSPGTTEYLPGCDNDIFTLYKYLLTKGYNNFSILTDSVALVGSFGESTVQLPTRDNIIETFNRVSAISNTKDYSEIFVHYSGHGTQIKTNMFGNVKEVDGKDECILSSDLNLITDDEMRHLISKFPRTSRLFCVMDACHSGTSLDLKYKLTGDIERNNVTTVHEQPELDAEVIMISGCRDEQTSLSVQQKGVWCGALSSAVVTVLKHVEETAEDGELSVVTFLELCRGRLTKYPQIPTITGSREEFSSWRILCTELDFGVCV